MSKEIDAMHQCVQHLHISYLLAEGTEHEEKAFTQLSLARIKFNNLRLQELKEADERMAKEIEEKL